LELDAFADFVAAFDFGGLVAFCGDQLGDSFARVKVIGYYPDHF